MNVSASRRGAHGLQELKLRINHLIGVHPPGAGGEEDVLLTEHQGKAEPLCSVYDRSAMAHIRRLIDQDQLKITNAIAGLKTRVVSFDRNEWFRGNEFANINSIEELKKYDS